MAKAEKLAASRKPVALALVFDMAIGAAATFAIVAVTVPSIFAPAPTRYGGGSGAAGGSAGNDFWSRDWKNDDQFYKIVPMDMRESSRGVYNLLRQQDLPTLIWLQDQPPEAVCQTIGTACLAFPAATMRNLIATAIAAIQSDDQQASESRTAYRSGIISALVGALAGGAFGWFGSWIERRSERRTT